MKSIVAFIRPSKEESVREALHDAPGVVGATFFDVRGFGRGRGQTSAALAEAVVGTLPKVRVDVMVPDEHADTVSKVIAQAARTGNRGDGKVYILPVESALRIRTGESGIEAT